MDGWPGSKAMIGLFLFIVASVFVFNSIAKRVPQLGAIVQQGV